MKLSILICSLQKRLIDFANLAWKLEEQTKGKPVEILWLGDNRSMSVGEKRNKLLSLARGEYVCFIDDDDMVEDDYVEQILKGIEQKPDVVCFNVGFRNAEIGGEEIPAIFSIKNVFNQNLEDRRIRMPNHLMAVRRDLAQKAGFTEKSFGEDTDYGLRLRGKNKESAMLKTEYHCGKVLYHYRFDPHKSATHHLNPLYRKPVSEPMVKMDVVMVSDGSNPALMNMTQQAIDSIASEDVNVVVLEKAEKVRYNNADTFLQRRPFNYNQCLNEGAAMGNAEFICFTNNDVLFPKGFVDSVISQMKQVLPDGEGIEGPVFDILSVQNQQGYIHPEIISGFCFIMTRAAWSKIGKLNTRYPFWCADNITSEQIKEHKLKECRSNIKVTHFTSASLNYLDNATREKYTSACVKMFNRDYNKNILGFGI
jgi:glycosyltransferase involved in cell wall biosynthesis